MLIMIMFHGKGHKYLEHYDPLKSIRNRKQEEGMTVGSSYTYPLPVMR